jgi:DNA-binding NarL/FixJ family response regulator
VASIRIVLAEDNLLVREGLRALLGAQPEVEVLAWCATLDELLAAVELHRPHVVVTDIRMPPDQTDEGIRFAHHARREHPEMGVVALSQFVEPAYALALLDEGSARRGYLLKDRLVEPDHLMDAVRAVVAGGSFIDDAVIDALVAARRGGSVLDQLTPRESEILREVAAGRSNRAIAAALGISDRAVEKHVSSIFTKLGVPDDVDVHRRVTAALVLLRRASG